ncbi:hypothetical protein [Flavobacterium sandaracinum]|uniref:Universal stress protein n=1 Tax=Flavobacterium sandaracinum TaxID=2541733 RepID=A0A4R5CVF2_9FLAO|nr:hypothetical protein [Flavobacterium sandaracinum]TDE01855.1 hypothetical protein E0F91_13640 [Flavobacterium sandaracinum]
MKNILIPSILQSDTINAVKTAIKSSNGAKCQLILMLIADIPDTYSSANLLRNIDKGLSPTQESVLQLCREIISESKNYSLKIHHQYGISAPIIRNLMEYYTIGLTIMTPSFKSSQKKINTHCAQIIANSKCPILHTNTDFQEETFSQALYIKNSDSILNAEDLQAYVNTLFSLKIVSETKINDPQRAYDVEPFLTDAIAKNNINILIETRKPKKLKLLKKEKASFHEALGIPVLSLYEGIY